MLTQFRHYTDAELLRFIRNTPDHIAAEGELARRVLAEEFESEQVRIVEEEHDEANTSADSFESQLDVAKQRLADLKAMIAAA